MMIIRKILNRSLCKHCKGLYNDFTLFVKGIHDSYSWFMVTLPIHPVFLSIIGNDTETDAENDTVILTELPKRQQDVLLAISRNERITEKQMMQMFSVSIRICASDGRKSISIGAVRFSI